MSENAPAHAETEAKHDAANAAHDKNAEKHDAAKNVHDKQEAKHDTAKGDHDKDKAKHDTAKSDHDEHEKKADDHNKKTAAAAHPAPAAGPKGPGLWARTKTFFGTTVPSYMGYGRFDKAPEPGKLPRTIVETIKDEIHGLITNGPRWLMDNGKRLLKAGKTTGSAVLNSLNPKKLFRLDKLIARILSIKFEVASAIKDVLARTGTTVKEAYKGAIGNPLTRLGQQLDRIPVEKTPLAGSTLDKVKNMAKSTKDAVFKAMGWAVAPIVVPAKYIGEGLAKYIDKGRDGTVKYAA